MTRARRGGRADAARVSAVRAGDRRVAARAELRPRRVEGDRAPRRHVCTAGSVARARNPRSCARRWTSLSDGRPRLLFLGPPDEFAAHDRDGTVIVPMACESEGALEVYVEPFLPGAAAGCRRTFAGGARVHGPSARIDWDVAVVDDGGRAGEHPYPELVRTSLDSRGLGIGRSTAIVVATQGHYDDLALRAALATDAGYIGVVAAEKRASSLMQLLREEGATTSCAVHAPAGLDLGAVDERGDRGRGARRSRRAPGRR